jgi:hypothetical protein
MKAKLTVTGKELRDLLYTHFNGALSEKEGMEWVFFWEDMEVEKLNSGEFTITVPADYSETF